MMMLMMMMYVIDEKVAEIRDDDHGDHPRRTLGNGIYG
jgi:hypothetical protein